MIRAFLMGAVLLGVSGCAGAPPPPLDLRPTLEVKLVEGPTTKTRDISLEMVATNYGRQALCVEEAHLPVESTAGDSYFDIFSEDGRRIYHTGLMYDPAYAEANAFRVILPRQSIRSKVQIGRYFSLQTGVRYNFDIAIYAFYCSAFSRISSIPGFPLPTTLSVAKRRGDSLEWLNDDKGVVLDGGRIEFVLRQPAPE